MREAVVFLRRRSVGEAGCPTLRVREDGVLSMHLDGSSTAVLASGRLNLQRCGIRAAREDCEGNDDAGDDDAEGRKRRRHASGRPETAVDTSVGEVGAADGAQSGGTFECIEFGSNDVSAAAVGGKRSRCDDLHASIGYRAAHHAAIVWGASGVKLLVHQPRSGHVGDSSPRQPVACGFRLVFVPGSDSTAEISVDMDPRNRLRRDRPCYWYGGCHLMRQFWPLDGACLETGPFYQFDNGPNGINTLCEPTWVNTMGMLVTVDPNTKFLHVGMNAPVVGSSDEPISDRKGRLDAHAHASTAASSMRAPGSDAVAALPVRRRRRWAVGVQNLFRDVLPIGNRRHLDRRGRLGGGRRRDDCLNGAWGGFYDAIFGDNGIMGTNKDNETADGDGQLRIQARTSYACEDIDHPLRDWRGGSSSGDDELPASAAALDIELSFWDNVRDATRAALGALRKPERRMDTTMISNPTWTTWANFHWSIDEKKVLAFAKDIVDRDLDHCVLEIDDKWQTKYGDLEFDASKFPDPKAMVDCLHRLGFMVTLWVIPFVEENSDAYTEGRARGFFVRSRDCSGPEVGRVDAAATRRQPSRESVSLFEWARNSLEDLVFGKLKPGFFRWWHAEPVVALDVTNPEAVAWFLRRLRSLQDRYGIDGFKFDAGEPCFLPGRFETQRRLVNPSEYTHLWVSEVASKFPLAEVRCGHRTQSAPLLTRMGDRFSTFDLGNGLQSLIPTLLTSGVLGYPFCLPDIVGGNAYFGCNPDSELLVRWAQANALMPAVQFSIPPWKFDGALEHVRNALLLRARIGLPQIRQLLPAASERLEPICRPLWWLDPYDENTYDISDQFALGQNIVVAPVVERGAVSRDVYLPVSGSTWIEIDASFDIDSHQQIHNGRCINEEGPTRVPGGSWIRDVDAPISKLPCYLRVA